MADQIRVRLYNVGFGDAILVTIPDRDENSLPLDRHVLIDVGNVLVGEGGADDIFGPVLGDIRDTVGSRGVDLYIMTHEHLDHVQGLLYGAETLQPPVTIPVTTAWLTASAADDYYQRFDEARKRFENAKSMYRAIARHLAASADQDRRLLALMANNNHRKTANCVDFLRNRLTDDVRYVYRGFQTDGAHPFKTATFDIWAPEEDTAEYYGRFRPMAFGAANGLSPSETRRSPPPSGVDARSFFNLVDLRQHGAMANALAIDKARNNTSVVFTITWNDHVLLFAGDAELRSWRTMNRGVDRGQLDMGPVDFLKVSHHGSHNGTPDQEILDRILPLPAPAGVERIAAVSTCLHTYDTVPDDSTLDELRSRCSQVVSTLDTDLFVDVMIG